MRGDVSDDRSDGGSEAAVAQSAGVDVVAGFFGVKAGDIDYSAIINALGTALIHDSFLYENRDLYPELTSGVLRGLEALGNAWLGRELAIRLYMSRDFDTVGQLSTLHAAAITAFEEWLLTIDWLVSSVRYGKSEAQGGPSKQTRRRLACQVIGAIATLGAEHRLRTGLQPHFTQALALDPPRYDANTFLENRVPQQSQNWEVTRTGPDHQPTFVAVIATKDERTGRGEGTSKRLAREAAARDYIQRYLDPPRPKSRRRPFSLPADLTDRTVRVATRKAVGQLEREFALYPRWRPFLLQALVHSSWAYEHASAMKASRQKDNRLLAFVGSSVVDYEYVAAMTSAALESRPDSLTLLTPTDKQLARLSAALRLDDAMLLSRGEEQHRGQRSSISSNVFQAVVGAVYIGLQTPPLLVDKLPPRWSEFREALVSRQPRETDFKTTLQELAAACELAVSYGCSSEGPDHAKSFHARVELFSNVLNSRITVRGPRASSRKAAEQCGAKPIVEVINALGVPLIGGSPPPVRGSVFAMSHLLTVAQMRPAIAQRWAKRGFLGSSIAKPRELLRWARAADTFAGAHNITGVDSVQLSEFYRHSAVQRTPLRAAAAALTSVAHRLTEIADPSAINADLETDLVALCAVYRAAGESSSDPSSLADTASDWNLLYGRRLTIVGAPPAAELSPGERSMLDCLVGRMADIHRALLVSFEKMSMRVAPEDGQIDTSVPRFAGLFADLSTRVDVSVDGDALSVGFLKSVRDSDGPITWAVNAALTPEPSPLSSSIANTLHDMKNQISAARQAAAIPPDVTGTQRLSKQLIASQHLDQAKILATQLQAAGSLATTSSGTTELSSYLRSFGANLHQRLPLQFHVVPKSPKSPVLVPVDDVHLGAILDNLVKNTQEALPDGGTIELSATVGDGVVCIEFSDDGPGVPDTVVDAVSRGQSVQTTKLSGTGLGLLGIRDLVRRAGGALTYVAGRPGACWQITLPVSDDDSAEGDKS